MRVSRLWGLIGALGLSGCNLLTQAQVGPVVAIAEKKAHVGAEGNATIYLDMRAGDDWADCHFGNGSCQHPEVATRAGIRSGVFARGTDLGVALGLEPGYFFGRTDGQKLFLLSAAGRFGFETLKGTAYGSAGASALFTSGLVVHKSYDLRAHILCRELTYLTASLQGTIDYLPAATGSPAIPGVSLLFGVISLDDGGADSDAGLSRGTCPR
jgi:hypothetical protein